MRGRQPVDARCSTGSPTLAETCHNDSAQRFTTAFLKKVAPFARPLFFTQGEVLGKL